MRKRAMMMFILCVGAMLIFAGESVCQKQASSPRASQAVSAVESEGSGSGSMDEAGRVLFVFLVLSVVFEVALTPIFNWRMFMAHFEGKGYKTPITVVLAFIVFWGYGLDIISELLTALGKPTGKSVGGQILTALLIAGGSSGVFQIFTKLKIRMDPQERQQKTEQARQRIVSRKVIGKESKTTET